MQSGKIDRMLQHWGRVHHKENTVRIAQESTVMEKTDMKNCELVYQTIVKQTEKKQKQSSFITKISPLKLKEAFDNSEKN